MIERFIRFADRLSLASGVLAAAMIAVSILVVCEMIVVRYLLDRSTIWQTEFVTYMMLSATLVGMPYVQRLRGHVNVDLLPHYLGGRARAVLATAVLLLSLGVAGLFAVYGYGFWHEAWAGDWKSDTVWGVRLWLPYAAVPIGFALYSLQLLADLLGLLAGRSRPFDLPDKPLGEPSGGPAGQ
ncbi:TRAP-type C4-dicarboxylate transport system, small permease component [Tistlia consotensis]|uniref:TRAP transporter small permease protein n=1 Tax=Tistlia consotensis USBA 355 TaxID=560819 RepID=A0A1Y6CB91_9PROT|nr:TRAP transporter small permease [Tistlia consotensis]SMF43983.1 TRAP-type C4-dicarboxylate transport system, small permease component [Tistlia consotensis USBA 355]SNR42998.1 TRAP-type C4-dicarboxylate transport system, small permease component [Tistlia consotensis]